MKITGRLMPQWKFAFVVGLSLAGCHSSTREEQLELRFVADPVFWLHEAPTERPTPGSGPLIRVTGTLHNGTGDSIHGLTVTSKSCSCFNVELGNPSLQPGESTSCSLLLAASHSLGNPMQFRILGNAQRDGGEIPLELSGQVKPYLVRHWHSQVPSLAFHVTDGDVAGESIVIRQFTRTLQEVQDPGFHVDAGPKWLTIGTVRLIGQQSILPEIVASEYQVELVAAAAPFHPDAPSREAKSGNLKLRCGKDESETLEFPYRVVSHDPFFQPSIVLFRETSVGMTVGRIVTLSGAATNDLRFRCTPDVLSAEILSPATPKDDSSGEAIQVRIAFAPTTTGLMEGRVVAERSSDGKPLAVLEVRGKVVDGTQTSAKE